jgi:hypothetical protein
MCRVCSTRKTYADITKLGPKKPPATPAAKAAAATPTSLAASPTPPTTSSTPSAATTAAAIAAIKVKLAALQAAKLANEAADMPTQQIDDQTSALTKQLHAMKPAGVQLDGLRAAIGRAEKRLAKAAADSEDAQLRFVTETELSASLHAELLALETSMGNTTSVACLPPAVASKLQDAIASLRSGIAYPPEEMAAFLEKMLTPPPTPMTATTAPTANLINTDTTTGVTTEQGDDISEMDETSGVNAWSGPGTGEEAPEPTPWHEAAEAPAPTPWQAGLTPVGKTAWTPSAPTHLSSPARRARGKNYVETPQLAQGA